MESRRTKKFRTKTTKSQKRKSYVKITYLNKREEKTIQMSDFETKIGCKSSSYSIVDLF